MSIVVQKYGGSSVADVTRMRQVAERVMRTRRQGHDVVVVVSAMGDTTDDLLAPAKQVYQSRSARAGHASHRGRANLVASFRRIRELGSGSHQLHRQAIHHRTTLRRRPHHRSAAYREDELARGGSSSRRYGVCHIGGIDARRGGSDTTAVAMAAALGAECRGSAPLDGVTRPIPRVVADTARLARCRKKPAGRIGRGC